jgi:hypothetical protein
MAGVDVSEVPESRTAEMDPVVERGESSDEKAHLRLAVLQFTQTG